MSDDITHAELEAERDAAQPHPEKVSAFRSYALGRQRNTLTLGQMRILQGVVMGGNLHADNVCRMVVQSLANRLLLLRFAIAGQGSAAAQVEGYLRELWTKNQLPALAAAAHYATLRDGNHAIMLSWQGDAAGRALLTRERWWNGDQGVYVAYDPLGGPRYAVKEWTAPEGLRRTVWYPDRLQRYLAGGDGWRPYALPWRDRAGRPLGIPVVHLAAADVPADGDQPSDDAAAYGSSVLDGGVLGLQDEINDVQRDITAAARFAGYQMLYATGVTPRYGLDGERERLVVEPGALFEDESPAAAFGTLPAGSLVELERTLTVKLQAVARQTAVPMHLFGGAWPSGEALMRAERPLTDRVEALARVIGPAWSSIAHQATRLAQTFGGAQLDPDLLITAVFAPSERRDPLARSSIATAEAPFVSRRETLRTLGRSPEEIERILTELDQEAPKAPPPPTTLPTAPASSLAVPGGPGGPEQMPVM
jgi:hypothetical protein